MSIRPKELIGRHTSCNGGINRSVILSITKYIDNTRHYIDYLSRLCDKTRSRCHTSVSIRYSNGIKPTRNSADILSRSTITPSIGIISNTTRHTQIYSSSTLSITQYIGQDKSRIERRCRLCDIDRSIGHTSRRIGNTHRIGSGNDVVKILISGIIRPYITVRSTSSKNRKINSSGVVSITKYIGTQVLK